MRLPWRRAAIERAAWLADDLLLTVGWCVAPGEMLCATLEGHGEPQSLEARWIAYPRPDLDAPGGAGRLSVIRFPSPPQRHQPGILALQSGGARWSVSMRDLPKLTAALRDTIAWGVGWLDPATRAAILAFLCDSHGSRPESAGQMSESLAAVRDVLRPALPVRTMSQTEPYGASLDLVLRVDERSFYLKGWAYLSGWPPSRLRATSPEGHAVDLPETAFRFRHAGVEQMYGDGAGHAGFIAFVRLPTPSLALDGWLIEVVGRDGVGSQSSQCRVTAGTSSARRDAILADLVFDPDSNRRLIDHHIAPAIRGLQKIDDGSPVGDVVRYGTPVANAEVSIVVPLFKRIDLIEYQLAQFALDRDMHQADLIYVLDSPELGDRLRILARELHDLYRIPFRVIFLSRSVGFATASNTGISHAAGRLMLLLNSDVFPSAAGWLRRMQAFYDATPRIGALGVKLLYEDDTLQHAGLYFRRDRGARIWKNDHYYRGLGRTFQPANIARRVPGVTGACLMVSKALCLEHGPLSSTYVRGDYEDSDLCLRLLTAGYDNWYLPDVELYHLEAQSYQRADRRHATQYNAWIHTHLWNDAIEAAMARFDS